MYWMLHYLPSTLVPMAWHNNEIKAVPAFYCHSPGCNQPSRYDPGMTYHQQKGWVIPPRYQIGHGRSTWTCRVCTGKPTWNLPRHIVDPRTSRPEFATSTADRQRYTSCDLGFYVQRYHIMPFNIPVISPLGVLGPRVPCAVLKHHNGETINFPAAWVSNY